MLKKFLSTHALLIAITIAGFVGWYVSRSYMEASAAFIGPEFLVRAFVSVFRGGCALGLSLLFVKVLFPTLWDYTEPFDQKESEFRKAWRKNPSDNRLWISCLVYVGVFYSLCQLLAL